MIRTFEIVYTKSAANAIKKLDAVARKKLRLKIERYLKNPLGYATKLINPALGNYRWRVGNYRIIFDIDGNKIVVLKAAHRKDIYK